MRTFATTLVALTLWWLAAGIAAAHTAREFRPDHGRHRDDPSGSRHIDVQRRHQSSIRDHRRQQCRRSQLDNRPSPPGRGTTSHRHHGGQIVPQAASTPSATAWYQRMATPYPAPTNSRSLVFPAGPNLQPPFPRLPPPPRRLHRNHRPPPQDRTPKKHPSSSQPSPAWSSAGVIALWQSWRRRRARAPLSEAGSADSATPPGDEARTPPSG